MRHNIPLKNISLRYLFSLIFEPLSANSTKWSNTLKQFVGKLPTICFSAFDYFVGPEIKGLRAYTLSRFQYLINEQVEVFFYSILYSVLI